MLPLTEANPREGVRADDRLPAVLRGPSGLAVAKAAAEEQGVCIRPIVKRRIEVDTGRSDVVPVACGATRAAVCKPCAEKNRRKRIDQCREGWHLDDEPPSRVRESTVDERSLMTYRADVLAMGRDALADGDAGAVEDAREALSEIDAGLRQSGVTTGNLPGVEDAAGPSKRVRSTRRRADAPDLPRKPVEQRTIGRVYAGKFRPSMFVTLTLPSYGPVHSAYRRGGRIQRCGCGQTHREDAALLGTPVDPGSYDYRQAAWDAVHFSSLVDRFWQNLRRAAGWDVQYFAAVEAQRRLVPHLHTALRGSIPRTLLKQVIAGTYHHVWWPEIGDPVYGGDHLPVWNPDSGAWCDPDTREPLTAFDDALPPADAGSEDAAHVVRFGGQADIRGVLGGSEESKRHIRYLTKYLTKSIGETYADASHAHQAHADRLLAELAITPCSPSCAVWLLHGIAPRGARSGHVPGQCRGNAHKRHTLGVAGRRVLVSRRWSGKTLAEHGKQRQAHVRDVLTEAGVASDSTMDSSSPATGRVVWQAVAPHDPAVPSAASRLLDQIRIVRQRRSDYQQASRVLAAQNSGNPAGRG